MRSKQLFTLLAACLFAGVTILLLRNSSQLGRLRPSIPKQTQPDNPQPVSSASEITLPTDKPLPLTGESLPLASTGFHPIRELIQDGEKEFSAILVKQSKSLDEAVKEYRRRYKLHPPPNFDKWYNFAVEKGVQLIDEYDTIYHSLLPFWALEPSVIRGRARESIGYDNALFGMFVRGGSIAKMNGGDDWQQKATAGMMKSFLKYLPDMDLMFNIHDEPRVVVPHDDLIRLVQKATGKAIPAASDKRSPNNTWSSRPSDMDDGTRLPETRITRFNVFAHQPTWTHSRASCSPDSPSRALDEKLEDNNSSYAFPPLNFVQNKTSFSDICMSPSLRETFGFFDRSNAFNIVNDLFPIFSQSKISSYQDILYPSPWYWKGKAPYNEYEDYEWKRKENKMYWRGSTTGGFSRHGGWRRQHRQRFVQKINALDTTIFLENITTEGETGWQMKKAPKRGMKDLVDVHFSSVGQCEEVDCDAQLEFFEVVKGAPREEAWLYKYLIDIDGNAFSGRFYAFLLSKSLVFKIAIFREWHEEWLKPWVHYVPWGLYGDEYFESLRYFDQEEEGRAYALRLAIQGRDWAAKALRNEDLEVWFFRLLLEYGRLVDDNRENLGFKT